MNRTLATTLLDVTGCALLVAAAALVWVPAGLAAAGASLLVISWRSAR